MFALVIPCIALAGDGDSCASQGYATLTNSAGCVIACDDATGDGYQCNGGAGFAPPSGYRGGTVRVEIADGPASGCFVEVFEGATVGGRHPVDTVACGAGRATIRDHVAGRLYLDVFGGPMDVLIHFEQGD